MDEKVLRMVVPERFNPGSYVPYFSGKFFSVTAKQIYVRYLFFKKFRKFFKEFSPSRDIGVQDNVKSNSIKTITAQSQVQ